MMHTTSRTIRFLLALAWTAGALPAYAAVTTVTTTPPGSLTALTRATTVAVTWNVASNTGGTLTSTQGVFRTTGGTVLGTSTQSLTKNLPAAGTATISETLIVPVDVAQRARAAGAGQFLYERSFNDGGGAAAGSITLHLASESAAAFSISRIALSFDDGGGVTIAERGAPLKANALVGYTGSGTLEAVWEIAGPNPSAEPQYRVLATVQRQLSGGEQASVQSPELPTGATGMYLLRLNVKAPALSIDVPAARYFVNEGKN